MSKRSEEGQQFGAAPMSGRCAHLDPCLLRIPDTGRRCNAPAPIAGFPRRISPSSLGGINAAVEFYNARSRPIF